MRALFFEILIFGSYLKRLHDLEPAFIFIGANFCGTFYWALCCVSFPDEAFGRRPRPETAFGLGEVIAA